MGDLSHIFKAYDIRGVVPDQFDALRARVIGQAFVETVVRSVETRTSVVVGRDMRSTGPELAAAFAEGARAAGAVVHDVGLCSTDELYFASGHLQAAGAMFTASHNPAEYNGIKLCLPGARPVGQDTGLRDVEQRAQELLDDPASIVSVGGCEPVDVLGAYAAHLRGLVDLAGSRPLRVVVDAGNGMAGLTVPAVLGDAAGLPALPVEIIPLFFELDGRFPNHEANPIVPANTAALQTEVVRRGADLGLAFDGDADRCFVIDERGHRVDPSVLTALIGLRESRRVRAHGEQPVVLHNLITSRFVPEVLARDGVRTVRTRVGHSFIKTLMASENAVFGGEHSGHYYFRDFFGADSGLLAAMHVLSALATDTRPLSVVAGELDPYSRSGEIDLPVQDVEAAQRALIDGFRADDPASGLELDTLDGVMISHWDDDIASADRWWLSIRPSNTEPLLRLNIEAASTEAVHARREKALAALRRH
ncbi:phosphomannomutase/phosphoglucomutase [Microbacterium sp.]|uniref:phosphomannomutase/phosphoglucomutase n=1 Tax=Microbacterium sp. TaxID=51671 RepID=UPI003F9BFD61